MNRVVFTDMEDRFGKIISVSNNGRLFIFKKNWRHLELLKRKGYTKQQLKEEYMTIYLLHLSIFEFEFVKKITIYKGIKDYVKNHAKKAKLTPSSLNWILDADYDSLEKNLSFKFILNNHFDVCIRIRNNKDAER